MDKHFKVILATVLLVLAAVISFTFVADKAMSVETHEATILSLDDKTATVKALTAASTIASVGVTALPGDVATPIADKLADLTEYFLVVMCVLYAEKYLLTLIGAAVFRIVVPLVCVLLIVGMFRNSRTLKNIAVKMLIFGLLLYIIVPVSVKASDMIYATYQVSIDETISQAEDLTDKTDVISDANENASVIDKALSYFKETTTGLTEKAANVLNRFTESLAVMIVTTCIIPILVLLFFIWLFKILWDVRLPVPSILTKRRRKNKLVGGSAALLSDGKDKKDKKQD